MLLKVFGFGTVSFLPIIEFAQILFLKIISMFPSKLRGEGGGMGETRNRRDYCTGGCVCVCVLLVSFRSFFFSFLTQFNSKIEFTFVAHFELSKSVREYLCKSMIRL